MNTYTKAEREAYKAGCRAVERRVAAAMVSEAVENVALSELWALLGADNQTQAVQAIKDLMATITDAGNQIKKRDEEIANCYREVDNLYSSLKASKYMGEHYRKERDKLDEALTKANSANLGFASTAELLYELQARARTGGYDSYRTIDKSRVAD